MNSLDKLASLNMKRGQLPGLINKLRATGEQLVDEDMEYRQRLSEEAIRLHREEGTVWSVSQDIAKGMDSVASVRHKRDRLANERDSLKAEIKAVMLEMEILEKELDRDYKLRRAV